MLGQKQGIQLVFTFDCVPRYPWNFAAFHLTYSWPGHWTLHIISKVVRVKFCRRNAQPIKPLLTTPVVNDKLLHLLKQFNWENESPQKFRATLRTEHMQRMINEFPDDTVSSENVITSLDAVETIFTATAKRSLNTKTTTKGRRNEISFSKKWFDKEVSEARTTKTGQKKTPRSSQY